MWGGWLEAAWVRWWGVSWSQPIGRLTLWCSGHWTSARSTYTDAYVSYLRKHLLLLQLPVLLCRTTQGAHS